MPIPIACILSSVDLSHLVLIFNSGLIHLRIFDAQKSFATAAINPTRRTDLPRSTYRGTIIAAETCIFDLRRLSFSVGELYETRRCHMR